jgi:hypothetical protein
MSDTSQGSLRAKFIAQVELRLAIMEPWIANMAIPWKTGPGGNQLRDEQGELLPDFVPTNLSQFCNWKASMSSAASGSSVSKVRPISRETFSKGYNDDLRLRAEAKWTAAKSCLIHQLESKNKTSIIDQLHAQVKLLNDIVDAQQRESRNARLRLAEMTTKYRMRHDESRREIARLKTDLSVEQENVARLTAAMTKVSRLRPVAA